MAVHLFSMDEKINKGGYKLIEEIPQNSENPLAEGPVGFVFVYVI